MPELPEVETVRAGLERILGSTSVIARITSSGAKLRRPLPRALAQRLAGQPISGVQRRAKYLLFQTPVGSLLSHLGMTGSWRLAPEGDDRPHDHVALHLADGRRLVFRDPRRFGLVGFVPPDGRHACLDELGPEPLGPEFTAAYLADRCRSRRTPIKVLIMDQAEVVGVGNIYAQEALFRAGIAPRRQAGRIPRAALDRLVAEIRAILAEAIAGGGTTINDYRQADGNSGWFQLDLAVYGRGGEACRTCSSTLKSAAIGGRTTAWCPVCQR